MNTPAIQIYLIDDHQVVLDSISCMINDEPDMEICGTAHSENVSTIHD